MSFGYDTRSAQLAQPTTKPKAVEDTSKGDALPKSTSNMLLDRADGTRDKTVAAATTAKATATQSATSSGKNVLEYLASQLNECIPEFLKAQENVEKRRFGDEGPYNELDDISTGISRVKDTALAAASMIAATYRDDREKLVLSAKKAIAQWKFVHDDMARSAAFYEETYSKLGGGGVNAKADVGKIDTAIKGFGVPLLHPDLATVPTDAADLASAATMQEQTLDGYIATARDALSSVTAGNDGDVVKLEAITPHLVQLQAAAKKTHQPNAAYAKLRDGLKAEVDAQRKIHNLRLANRLAAVLAQITTLAPETKR